MTGWTEICFFLLYFLCFSNANHCIALQSHIRNQIRRIRFVTQPRGFKYFFLSFLRFQTPKMIYYLTQSVYRIVFFKHANCWQLKRCHLEMTERYKPLIDHKNKKNYKLKWAVIYSLLEIDNQKSLKYLGRILHVRLTLAGGWLIRRNVDGNYKELTRCKPKVKTNP